MRRDQAEADQAEAATQAAERKGLQELFAIAQLDESASGRG